jgi:hypothetical protein
MRLNWLSVKPGEVHLSEKFKRFFYLNGNDCQGLNISYCCKINGSNFTLSVAWDDQQRKLVWKSDYLTKKMPEWACHFISPDTPDMAQIVKNLIHDEIKHDFAEKLPIACMFVPSSRAALAVVGSNTEFKDPYLYSFARDKDYLLSDPDISLSAELADILKVKNIKKILKIILMLYLNTKMEEMSPLYFPPADSKSWCIFCY